MARSSSSTTNVEARKAAFDEAMKKKAEKEAAETAATYDAIAKPPEAPEPEPESNVGPGDVVYTADAEGDDYEDGVLIEYSERPMWCSSSGRSKGFCFASVNDCKKKAGPSCSAATAFACFAATTRTTGKQYVLCVNSYGTCQRLHMVMEADPESSDVGDCWIGRVKKKPSKKR